MDGRVVAIIPARGGSKGLPGKNVRELAGKPLIGYSIRAALDCSLVARCIVSTDDPIIKSLSLDLGAEVVDRPAEFAADASPTQDAVRHVLQKLASAAQLPEYFVLLQPTSPLRSARHLTEALRTLMASRAACIIGVTETEHHPYKSHTLEGGELRPLFGSELLNRPRQSLPPVYRENGSIYAMKCETFLAQNSFFVTPAIPFVMPREASVDIDTLQDFILAETILGGVNA